VVFFRIAGRIKKGDEKILKEQEKDIRGLKVSKEVLQYYHAMGYNVNCRNTYGLPAAVYVAELRSGKTVHPTLRKVAHKMCGALTKMFPILKLYPDKSLGDFDIRRGMQTIIEKK